ncbi:MAG: hypothetical protein E4G89_01470 [Methanothrix sp.]|nr:MAG: hypothetical protein E4G89_01470 [Methanothrix sp.]
MGEDSKKWIPIASGVQEGARSEKQVISTDLINVRTKNIDEHALGSTRIVYRLGGIWQDKFSFNDTTYDRFDMPEGAPMQIIGSPALPQEGLFVAIPENAEVKEVRIISKKEKDLENSYLVLPASKPVFEGEEEEYIPNKAVYESDDPYPGKNIELVGTQHLAGRKVAHIMVYLANYRPKSKNLSILESIEFEVVYETKPGMDAAPLRKLLRKSPIDSMILDTESMAKAERLKSEMGGFELRGTETKDALILKNPNIDAEYVIITTDDLKNSFNTLVDRTVKVVTTTEILREFPNTMEDVAIKNFLIYATDNWRGPPQWVILGGDVNKVPTHKNNWETTAPPGETDIASDHFYSDLRGDILPEIIVSRFPISDPGQMMKLCEKAVLYGRYDGGWRNNCLLTAFNRSDYIDCKENIAGNIGAHFNVIKKYDGQSSKADVIDVINRGIGIINYRGHGSDTSWQAGNGLANGDVPNLSSSDKIPMILSIACNNNRIDMTGECFGEMWIKYMKAITFLGASRPSYTSINHSFDKFLFDGILNHNLTKAGEIMNWGTAALYRSMNSPYIRDNIRMYLLLGDPTADFGGKIQGYYRIKAKHSGKCLDVTGSSQENGAEIIQWPCHSGNNQKFKLEPIEGESGYYRIMAKHSESVWTSQVPPRKMVQRLSSGRAMAETTRSLNWNS